DQRRAHVANWQEQRRTGLIRIPKVVPTQRRHAAWDVEAATAQQTTLCAVCFEELATLIRCLDLAQLARRDIGIKDIEAFVVGEEQRGVAAGPCRWECAAAAPTAAIQRGRGQVPEGESGESSARADQQRFLQLAQGDRPVRGLVAKRALPHLEAETEPPRAPAIEGLEQRVGPGQVQQFRLSLHRNPAKHATRAEQAKNVTLYWISEMVQFCSLQ